MMMERSKPAAAAAPASEQAAKPSSSVEVQSNSYTANTTASAKNASSEERVRDLERRLDALDGAEKNSSSVAPITSTIDVDTAATATATTAITEPASTTAAATAASHPSLAASAPPNPLLVRVCACV